MIACDSPVSDSFPASGKANLGALLIAGLDFDFEDLLGGPAVAQFPADFEVFRRAVEEVFEGKREGTGDFLRFALSAGRVPRCSGVG